jgi:hypothetical protein
MNRRNTVTGAAFLALTASLTACSVGAPTQGTPSGEAPSAEEIASALPGLSLDYEVSRSTEELAKKADIVAIGSVAGIADGPRYGRFDDELTDIGSVLVQLRPTDVVQGEAKADLYVSLIAPAGVTAESLSGVLPNGTNVVVYASRSAEPGADPSAAGIDVDEWQKGRPAGEPILVPLAQGFIVEGRDGGLGWPLTGATATASLEDALPGGPVVGIESD